MQTIELKSLVKQGVLKRIYNLHLNANDYPFVTLFSTGCADQNLYFGKAFAEEILEGYEEGDNVINELMAAVIVQTENANGDLRYKIGRSTNYLSSAGLAAAFGLELEEQVTDFDLDDFVAEFETKPDDTPQELSKTQLGKLKKAA